MTTYRCLEQRGASFNSHERQLCACSRLACALLIHSCPLRQMGLGVERVDEQFLDVVGGVLSAAAERGEVGEETRGADDRESTRRVASVSVRVSAAQKLGPGHSAACPMTEAQRADHVSRFAHGTPTSTAIRRSLMGPNRSPAIPKSRDRPGGLRFGLGSQRCVHGGRQGASCRVAAFS